MALLRKQVQSQTSMAVAHIPDLGDLHVVYKPALITQDMVNKAQRSGDAAAIMPCLIDWDFYDVPPTFDAENNMTDPGLKMPINDESLVVLGLPNAMIMVGAIIDQELGKVSAATGRPLVSANGQTK